MGPRPRRRTPTRYIHSITDPLLYCGIYITERVRPILRGDQTTVGDLLQGLLRPDPKGEASGGVGQNFETHYI